MTGALTTGTLMTGLTSVEAALHRAWSMRQPLARLLPPERVFTGRAAIAADALITRPYASLERGPDERYTRTSSGTVLSVELYLLHVYADRLDVAQQIAAEVRACFHRFSAPLADGQLQDMKLRGVSQQQTSEGTWQITLEWTVRVAR